MVVILDKKQKRCKKKRKSKARKQYRAINYQTSGFALMVPLGTLFVNFYNILQDKHANYAPIFIQLGFGLMLTGVGVLLLKQGEKEYD